MNKYVDLANVSTKYATRMNHLSNRIFGEVTRSTNSKSMKVVKLFSALPLHKDPNIINYYPRHKEIDTLMDHLRNYGLFRNEHKDFIEEKQRLRELRGKMKWIPPPFRK
ncbi:28S ribosomal protein S33, mitochondrial [Colletes gigas]|uniref:28S ribosomal protein S33, mitochondrial n=1 Tax=Colletes gigas TaxID=935657 RepID=UPI001C9B1FE6|nr:28S ribosomal protein S33, mitochondrial [Colletes gigas]